MFLKFSFNFFPDANLNLEEVEVPLVVILEGPLKEESPVRWKLTPHMSW